MMTATPAFYAHRGDRVWTIRDLHFTPVGYHRYPIPPGHPLPVPPSRPLLDAMSSAREIEIAFHGKLGDTLLALSAVRAAQEHIVLTQRTPPRITITGPYAPLLFRLTLPGLDLLSQPEPSRIIVGDREGVHASDGTHAAAIICDPAAPPCWAADDRAFPDLPARHYLAVERRLGLRLPAAAPFAPLLAAQPSNHLVQQLHDAGWLDGLSIAAITATSWPARKDFGTDAYIELAERLALHVDRPVRLLIIGGHTSDGEPAMSQASRPAAQILTLNGISSPDLADLMPHLKLVVGNDTGLTHLAALARNPDGSGPHIIGLYGRHSHSKWRTGLPHHHAIATTTSENMHRADLCPVRDHLQLDNDGLATITTPHVADLAAALL